jgi:hypothetical protein
MTDDDVTPVLTESGVYMVFRDTSLLSNFGRDISYAE